MDRGRVCPAHGNRSSILSGAADADLPAALHALSLRRPGFPGASRCPSAPARGWLAAPSGLLAADFAGARRDHRIPGSGRQRGHAGLVLRRLFGTGPAQFLRSGDAARKPVRLRSAVVSSVLPSAGLRRAPRIRPGPLYRARRVRGGTAVRAFSGRAERVAHPGFSECPDGRALPSVHPHRPGRRRAASAGGDPAHADRLLPRPGRPVLRRLPPPWRAGPLCQRIRMLGRLRRGRPHARLGGSLSRWRRVARLRSLPRVGRFHGACRRRRRCRTPPGRPHHRHVSRKSESGDDAFKLLCKPGRRM